MSHVVQITTQVRDPLAVHAGCRRLGLPTPTAGETKLFSQTVRGLAVQLPKWRYPVVFDTANGNVQFDNYEGQWGDPAQLDTFLQAYAVEKATLEARRQGYAVREQSLSDGSIQLTVSVGGAS